jgi:hypothetical protein
MIIVQWFHRVTPTPVAHADALRVRSTHSRHDPLGGRGDVDQNTIADARERKPIRLSHPAPHSTWMPVELTRERLKIREVREKVFNSV